MRYFCLVLLCSQFFFISVSGYVFKTGNDTTLTSVYSSLKKLFGAQKLGTFLDSIRNLFSVTSRVKDAESVPEKVNEDEFLDAIQLAAKYGYYMEEHTVTTEDGYILTMHRLCNNKNVTRKPGAVFLMHGLMDSSDSWLLQGPQKALAYYLVQKGFDVWMGNARGNKYSSNHIKLDSKNPKFWRFSWEEIGTLDLPAMIDYVLFATKQINVYYIGHSQGTTSFFVMCSMRPEYNRKISLMLALSPVAFMKHVKSPIVKLFSPANKILSYWMSSFDTYAPSVEFINQLMSVICYIIPRCDSALNLIVGNNNHLIDKALLPVVFSHIPSGSSTLQFVHYGQLVQSGRFCRYDFGKELNYQIYRMIKPPEYNLNKVTTAIVLFTSKNDWLADQEDVETLINKLPRIKGIHSVPDFNHLDFMYASVAKEQIYTKIVLYLENRVRRMPFLSKSYD